MRSEFNFLLYPFAKLYEMGVRFRNFCFDYGWIASHSYDIPIISIGNLSVGGTGKTPHTEMLIRLLSNEYNVAVLSRGYKRKTKGYVLANDKSTASDIGDEPFQMHQKFKNIRVAVCANRNQGIQQLLTLQSPKVDVILLDDAFQHRYVKPGLSILLTEFNKLYSDDYLLPMGRLREPAEGAMRANIIIVTKCPKNVSQIERRILLKKINARPYQATYMSRFKYGKPYELFEMNRIFPKQANVLLITGIAHPQNLMQYLVDKGHHVESINFPDHHNFSNADITHINRTFEKLPQQNAIIVTTEKDAARIMLLQGLSEKVKQNIWVQPIDIEIKNNKTSDFNRKIIDYVRTNKRNC